ncbi:NAD(P)-dependent dehydrogenase, short-chain alcohol dehydrogenase family [Paenibacillus sophorae]|uniref:NAD(P)-dependent dehydrogenase, short-chain alcohol dehydrogenase family n=1 Tax=Paenibacillus sophorae TaxID=1333845 RepID=A0A1H8TH82_9BACL|nr:SDR family oxidoreductase [Paenibacillus sophorae]QWU16186.1 SDR family oxidoreductase [Paenibacillus sophorae]SEO89934.1 NAD(P)-dependent dehydrogenase, short-chain alcohol dehydrogenase family [Paenibacillus sophorae]
MKRLEGKIALVTGGSRGIGRGIALRLAEDGALVAVHYGNRRDAADDVVRIIEEQGGQAIAIGAGLETVAGAKQLIQSLEEALLHHTGEARFDILVNNAGIGTSKSFEETTEEAFDEVFAVNVKAPFFLVQQALPLLRNDGRIINISSGVTRIAYPHIMAYNLTKGAINTFTLHLAQLLGPRGITVNAVLPGIVDTDVNASWLHTPEGQQHASEMSALDRVGQPSDIADIVAFLSSSDSRWVTGQMVDATGGSHL